MKDGKFLTMGIETSCDETAIAILADGRTVLSNVISSQIDIFKNYGGVVPEIASRHHLENINGVLDQSLEEAGVTLDDIDLIGVTHGPGLVGALLMGVSTAKALAFAKDLPLVGVHHLMSHISANFIEYPELEPPFMALITSGGHTEIVKVSEYNKCEILGGTRDDAVGEAYDKVARVLGLGYPGGPKIDKIAKEGDPDMKKRIRLVPLITFGPFAFIPLILVGAALDYFVFSQNGACVYILGGLGLLFYVYAIVLSVLTLRTEKKAQERAYIYLQANNMATASELEALRELFRLYNIQYINDIILASLELLYNVLQIAIALNKNSSKK